MFRKIQKTDRDAFIRLCAEFYSGSGVLHSVPRAVFERTFEELMRGEERLEGYLFEQNGQAVGYALLSRSFSTEVGGMQLWLEELYLQEAFRGQGDGGAFVEALLARLGPQVRRVRLEAAASNDGAIALYERLGFKALPYMQLICDFAAE